MDKGIDAMMEESLEEEYSKMNELESARILVERDEWRGMMLDTVHLFEETGLTPQTIKDIADELAGAAQELLKDYKGEHAAWIEEAQENTQPLIDNMQAALDKHKHLQEGE